MGFNGGLMGFNVGGAVTQLMKALLYDLHARVPAHFFHSPPAPPDVRFPHFFS